MSLVPSSRWRIATDLRSSKRTWFPCSVSTSSCLCIFPVLTSPSFLGMGDSCLGHVHPQVTRAESVCFSRALESHAPLTIISHSQPWQWSRSTLIDASLKVSRAFSRHGVFAFGVDLCSCTFTCCRSRFALGPFLRRDSVPPADPFFTQLTSPCPDVGPCPDCESSTGRTPRPNSQTW